MSWEAGTLIYDRQCYNGSVFRTCTNHCLTKETRPVELEVSQDLYSSCYVRRPMVDLRDFSTLNAQPHCYTYHSTSRLQASTTLVVREDFIYFVVQTLSVYRSTTTHREPI